MKLWFPTIASCAAAAAFMVSVAIAQTAPPGAAPPAFANPPHKNLKFLPQGISGPQLLGTMKLFTRSLGVRCTFCHVGEDGKPPSTYDFAADTKENKLTARKMLAMMHQINSQNFPVTDFRQTKVTCFTCHRGSTKPAAFPPPELPVLPSPAAGPGS
jgi:hypothetical protein